MGNRRPRLALAAAVGFGVVVGAVAGRGSVSWPFEERIAAGDRGAKVEVANGRLEAGGAVTLATEETIYRELERQYASFSPVNRTFELVSQVVAPSVVHIVAQKPDPGDGNRGASLDETGSGVIVRPERGGGALFVLTNHHVVADAEASRVLITLHDGRVVRPVGIWSDEMSDIAALRLPMADLPTARLGDSDDVSIGSWVLAMGSPFGLMHSVSQGIISARGRHERSLLDDGMLNQDFLQTDAAINPGNSGGPLVNLKGEVVGINTAIASNGGGNEGVGFSIPVNLAKWVLQQLIVDGRVRRGAVGVNLDDIRLDDAERIGLDRPRGARVVNVADNSPASQGGVRVGDVVVRFNGHEVTDTNHLINLVAMSPIGHAADLILVREGREIRASVKIADREATVVERGLQPAPTPSLPAGPQGLALPAPNQPGAIVPGAVRSRQ